MRSTQRKHRRRVFGRAGLCALIALGVTASAVLFISGARAAAAAAGDLDPSFPVQVTFGGLNYANGIVSQPDGKILVVGEFGDRNGNLDFGLRRFNADGAPDSTFGTGGQVRTDFKNDRANAIALQPDGKILLGGTANEGFNATPSNFTVIRYNPGGTLDPSFGNGQVVMTDFFGSSDSVAALAVQPDGKIIAFGQTSTSTDFRWALARYNPDGTLDPFFGTGGTGGKVVTEFGAYNPVPEALALQPDGKLIAVGHVVNGSTWDFAVIRYNADGTLDYSFGTFGRVYVAIRGGDDWCHAVVVQPDGKIALAGVSYLGEDSRFALARLNADGTPDTTFGEGGVLTTAFSEGRAEAHGLLLQPDGKLVAAGGFNLNNSRPDFGSGVALARYNPDGSLDTTFGAGGRVATTDNPQLNNAYGIAMQPDGRLVVAGSAIARYLNDLNLPTPTPTPTPASTPVPPGRLDATFGADGRVLLDVGGPGVESCATAVAIQPDDQKILVAGEVGGRLITQDGAVGRFVTAEMDFALVRLLPDGTYDQSFGTGGRVKTDIRFGDAAFAIALQPDKRILLAGVTSGGASQTDIALVRYDPGGTLDPSFGTGGKVRTDFGNTEAAYGLALQPDGKIVVTGRVGDAFTVVRYNANGTLDQSFGDGGRAFVTSGIGYSVAVQPDQKIVAAGTSSCNFAAPRLTTGGALEAYFGVDFGFNFCEEAHSVIIQPDGNILLVGDMTAKFFALQRYQPQGPLDQSFGNLGRLTTVFSGREAVATAAVERADGAIYAVGGAGPSFEPPNQPPAMWAIAAYNANGSNNIFFGNSGQVTTVMSNSSNRQQGGTAMGAALAAGDKLVVVGSAYDSKGVFGVAQYLTSGADASPPSNLVRFSAASYTPALGEADHFVNVTVVRTGDLSGAASVAYKTFDGSASATHDYTAASGRVEFAPGESSRVITLLFTDDSYVEGEESFSVELTNPSDGLALGGLTTASVLILDDDTAPGPNAIDNAANFVRQHYHDFLSREPDAAGLQFWTGQMTGCGSSDPLVCRVNVSAAFFLSIEFQETGYLVYKTFGAAYGVRRIGQTVPLTLQEFLPDTQRMGREVIVGAPSWEGRLEANKAAYFAEVVGRPEFRALYPDSMSAAQFVGALDANAGFVLSQAERQDLSARLGAGQLTRAGALRAVAENANYTAREKSRAFVLMQYFGYLRRNPSDAPEPTLDFAGYNFWLGKLNQFNGNYVRAELVKAFITSDEYRRRFGPQ